jgi:hypothetical protein
MTRPIVRGGHNPRIRAVRIIPKKAGKPHEQDYLRITVVRVRRSSRTGRDVIFNNDSYCASRRATLAVAPSTN